MVTADRDRGQVILIGAVAVALLLFGIVVVINSVLYTSTVAPHGASAAATDAETLERVVERDVGRLVDVLSEDRTYVGVRTVSESLELYSARLSEASVESGGGYVDVALNDTFGDTDTRIYQTQKSDFRGTDGQDPLVLLDAGNASEVLELELVLDGTVAASEPQAFTIVVENASSGATWSLAYYKDGSSGNVVDTYRNGSQFIGCSLEEATTTVTLDSASTDTTTCMFDFAGGVDAPYTVRFENTEPGKVEGTYDVLVDGRVPSAYFGTDESSEPQAERTITEVAVDVVVEDRSVSYATTIPGFTPDPTVGADTGTCGVAAQSEGFEDGSLGASDWEHIQGGSAGVTDHASENGTYSSYLDDGGPVGIGLVDPIDADDCDAITVKYWAKAGGGTSDADSPETGKNEDLVLEYRDESGTWVEADRIDAWGADEEFSRTVTVSSSGALHDTFDLRFVKPDATAMDRWYVDDIDIAPNSEGGGVTIETYVDENFEAGSFAATEWVADGTGGTVGLTESASRSGSKSVYLSDGTNTSVSFDGEADTTNATGLTVEYWAKAGNPDGGSPDLGDPDEYLVVEYRDANGTWAEVDRIDSWNDDQEFDRSATITDPDAFHDDFSIRFRRPRATWTDEWLVDDVTVEEETS